MVYHQLCVIAAHFYHGFHSLGPVNILTQYYVASITLYLRLRAADIAILLCLSSHSMGSEVKSRCTYKL